MIISIYYSILMSQSAKLLKQETDGNRVDGKEMRQEIFLVRSKLDRSVKEIFSLKQRISFLERDNSLVWKILYAILLGLVFYFQLYFIYFSLILIHKYLICILESISIRFSLQANTGWSKMYNY